MSYFVYIVRCADDTLYTGTTSNVQKRVTDHNTSPKGAKYTRSRRPVTLVYTERHETQSQALKREYNIKKLTKPQKEKLIQDTPPETNK